MYSGESDNISIIIPTLATVERAESLRRAIRSVTDDQTVPALPIVVVNGDRYDPDLLEALKADSSIRVFYLEEGNYPKAVAFGRQCVETPYFGFLDDDDEYLPGALEKRLSPFHADDSIDAVISNGYKKIGDTTELFFQDIEKIEKDNILQLLSRNWMASCGGLFKTEKIRGDLFERQAKYVEWTFFAFQLSLRKRIYFLDIPTFIINDTTGSLSKSNEFMEHIPIALNLMLSYEISDDVRRRIHDKIIDSFHSLSNHYYHQGDLKRAWACHIRSLSSFRGLYSYLLFTRRLIVPAALRQHW